MENNMSVSRSIAWNTSVQFIARIVGAAAQALIVIILARSFVTHFGAEEGVRQMGRYTTIFAFTVLFGTFSEFGLFPTLVKELSEKPDKARLILSKAIPLRMLVAFIVACLGVLLAFALRFEPIITIGIVLLAASTLWTAMSNTFVAYFQSRLLMVYPAIAEIAGRIVGLIVVGTAALMGASLLMIVSLSVLGFLITFLVNLWYLSRFEKLEWRIDLPYWHELMRVAAPVGIISVMSLVYFKIDSVMLAAMRDKFDVGVYGIPYKLVDVLISLPTLFVSNVFPVLARSLHEPARAQIIFRKAFDFLAIIGLGVSAGVFALSAPIIHLIGGQTYLTASSISFAGEAVGAVTVMRIIIWAVLASFFGGLLTIVIILKNLQSRYVWVVLLATVFNVVGNFMIIPRYTYLGTSIVTVLTEVIVGALGWIIVVRTTNFRPKWDVFMKAILAAFLMGVVLWPMQEWPYGIAVLVGLPVGAVVYVGTLHFTGALRFNELKRLMRRDMV